MAYFKRAEFWHRTGSGHSALVNVRLILASMGEPSLDTSHPKRPGARVLSSFVFLDTTAEFWHRTRLHLFP